MSTNASVCIRAAVLDAGFSVEVSGRQSLQASVKLAVNWNPNLVQEEKEKLKIGLWKRWCVMGVN